MEERKEVNFHLRVKAARHDPERGQYRVETNAAAAAPAIEMNLHILSRLFLFFFPSYLTIQYNTFSIHSFITDGKLSKVKSKLCMHLLLTC